MKKDLKELRSTNKTLGIITILVGIYSLILGIAGPISYSGAFVSKEAYGGDAYTGIQNASANTANNVDNLGDMCECTFRNAFAIAGILLVVKGTEKIVNSSIVDENTEDKK